MIQHGYWGINGRIGRKVFLRRYALPFFISLAALFVVAVILSKIFHNGDTGESMASAKPLHSVVISYTIMIFAIIPLAVTAFAFFIGEVKRLHDTRHTGTWVVLNFFPPLNIFLLLFLCVVKGPEETTEYGHNPVSRRRSRRSRRHSHKERE
jgi:uncharacterized membrane protein YhaH (DUF805 family)